MTVSLRTQAGEASLAFAEYRDWIDILEHTKDEKTRRTPEQLANMRIRLTHKQAIAETLKHLADRADARRAAEQGRAAE